MGEVINFIAVAGTVFCAWTVHDAIQEWLFSLQGFHFGAFMALLLQVALVGGSAFQEMFCAAPSEQPPAPTQPGAKAGEPQALLEAGGEGESSKKPMTRSEKINLMVHFIGLSVCIATSSSLANMALEEVQMPVKVLFKSSKLVPTMVFRVLMGNVKSNSYQDYAIAALICIGLATFSLADAKSNEAHFSSRGVAMLGGSVMMDAMAPNIQERLLVTYRCRKSQVVFHSNWVSAVFTLMYVTATSELRRGLEFSYERHEAAWGLAVQTLAGYVGVEVYLTLVSGHGSKTAVMVTSVRKMFTIALSFIFFKGKPFESMHALGLCLVIGGVGIETYKKMRNK